MTEPQPSHSGCALPGEPAYWCFISYRHADNHDQDREWASWLHREIERYAVPAELVGQVNSRGETIPERIYPVFRDEDSLPADADLGERIQEALKRARHLVVLCSPRAVASRYVTDEVRWFRELGREDCLIAAIVDGEPGNPQRECFPAPLRESSVGTPLAADFRLSDGGEGYTSAEAYRLAMNREGKLSKREIRKRAEAYDFRLQLMKLKIIAGILGVPLERLRDRDKAYRLELAERRVRTQRRLTIAFAGISLVAVIAGLLANDQRREAERERELSNFAWERASSRSTGSVHKEAGRLTLIETLFATNRLARENPRDPFGNERNRGGELSFGSLILAKPKEQGALDDLNWLTGRWGTRVAYAGAYTPGEFFEGVARRLNERNAEEILVFVGNFGSDFRSTALEFAEMNFALAFNGVPVFFSWPSQGRVSSYLLDSATAEWSAPHFAGFLTSMLDKFRDRKVHVVTSGMGGWLVLKAMAELDRQGGQAGKIDQLIVCGPDIDAEVFQQQILPKIATAAKRMTVYLMPNSPTLQASEIIHGSSRLGRTGMLIRPQFETVVWTGQAGRNLLSLPLLRDLRDVLRGAPADSRQNLVRMEAENGGCYWRLDEE